MSPKFRGAHMRKYIRHPSDIPLEFELGDVVANRREYLKDVSEGGLSFSSAEYLEPGSTIMIRIPLRNPVFETEGIIVWCRKETDGYEAGVRFSDSSSEFRVRMVEQVCHIAHYKAEVLEKEGRELSGEEAAVEWITKFAKDFPK